MSAPKDTLADALGEMPAKEFAAELLSGAVGLALLDQLRERFPAISREDAFLGAALALSIREADLLASQIELRHLHMALQGERA